MSTNELISFSQAARRYGVTRFTIADLAEKHGITPKRVTTGSGQGKAKGLDSTDLRLIRMALGMSNQTEPAAAR